MNTNITELKAALSISALAIILDMILVRGIIDTMTPIPVNTRTAPTILSSIIENFFIFKFL